MSSPHDDLEPLDDLEPMDELEPLDELEPVEELDALEPVEEAPAAEPVAVPSAAKAEAPAPAPAAVPAPEAADEPEAAAEPEAAPAAADPAPSPAADAPAEAGSRRKRGEEVGSQKRDLEQAPLELRKAAQVLTIGALFPFYYGVKFAVTAIQPEGNLDGFAQWAENSGAFPFAAFFLAKALAMAGGWVQLEGYKGAAGEVTKGIGLTLGKAHKLAPVGAAAVLWILALLIPMGALGLSVSNSYLTVGGVDGVLGGGLIAVELLALILAQATLAHIYAYEHGGKFNPIFPLMFLGPALAGVLQLVNVARIGSSNDPAWGWLGLLGSGICAAGGIMAMNVMMKAMKEAKAEGERKAEIIRQQRKAEREAKRAARQKK
jgi:hypothetical protein